MPARGAFRYLFLFFALGLAASCLCLLTFALVDYHLSDPLYPDTRPQLEEAIRLYLSVVVVAFLLHAFMAGRIAAGLQAEEIGPASAIRAWFTYLALFIAGTSFAGDLIALVYQFLNGELTSNVAIKVLAVAVVAGGLFTFYLGEMRRDRQGQLERSGSALRIYLALAGFVVFAVTIAGVLSVPSPSTQRAVRFDARRVLDLERISRVMDCYYQSQAALPSRLEDLDRWSPTGAARNYSVCGYSLNVLYLGRLEQKYQYRVVDAKEYELCANFSLASQKSEGQGQVSGRDWSHGLGRSCFTIQVSRRE